MRKLKLEYIWLDGNTPQQIRSKTKIVEWNDATRKDKFFSLEDCPPWSFDGSSTKQAEGHDSDCYLKPVFVCPDPLKFDGLLVLCEVYNADGSPHVTNTRHELVEAAEKYKDQEAWFGIEQEYFLFQNGKPLGFPSGHNAFPPPQGTYYCGVGADRVFGRRISEAHAEACMKAGLSICGTNAEVAPGQWEFQIGPIGPLEMGDQLWVARYLLNRIAEDYETTVYLDPKPLGKNSDWNGSGGHTNYSTKAMREDGGLAIIEEACKKLEKHHKIHMANYGEGNQDRMTGLHETCSYDTFKYGNSDRGCSVRIPLPTRLAGKGYFEDRRPAANQDPYLVCRLILITTCGE